MGPPTLWTEPGGVPGRMMRAWLRAAVTAPSVHNTQPWLFRGRPDGVEVLLDRRRLLPVLDPDGRELHLSVGAALFNLRASIHGHGWRPRVRLLPDPADPDLAAIVHVGTSVTVTDADKLMAQAIERRRSNRQPFTGDPVPESDLAALVAAAHQEGGRLLVLDPVSRSAVLNLVRAAEVRQRRDPRYRTELAYWTVRRMGRGDGVTPEAFGPRPALGGLPIRDFAVIGDRPTARFEADPTIAVLYSRGDEPADWLQAGQALQRVLLTATAAGLSTTLLTQPLEVPRLRGLFTGPHESGYAQTVIRIGYAPRIPRTPRRPLAEVLLRPRG